MNYCKPMITICVNCKHYDLVELRDIYGSKYYRSERCRAPTLVKLEVDPVNGHERETWPRCRDHNKGNCAEFEQSFSKQYQELLKGAISEENQRKTWTYAWTSLSVPVNATANR